MLILAWRMKYKLTVEQAAKALGLKSAGMLSTIERGISFPRPETIIQIDAATRGAVTAADHVTAWDRRHRSWAQKSRTAGRTAARVFNSGAGE